MEQEQEGLKFANFEVYFIYSFLFDIQAPAPLHVLLNKFNENSTGWGCGLKGKEFGLHPTLISIAEENVEELDKRVEDDDKENIHRLLWFNVNVSELFKKNGKFVLINEPDNDGCLVSLIIENRDNESEDDFNYKIKLSCTIRLFPSGVCTCTFKFNIQKENGNVDADHLLDNVVRLPRWDVIGTKFRLKIANNSKKVKKYDSLTCYKLFFRAIHRFYCYLKKVVLGGKTAEFLIKQSEDLWYESKEIKGNLKKSLENLLNVGKEEEKSTEQKRTEQKRKVEEMILQFANLKNPKAKSLSKIFRKRFPVNLVWCDREVCSEVCNDIDPQIPYLVGIGILENSPTKDENRFSFMRMPEENKPKQKDDKRHVQALDFMLRVLSRKAFKENKGRFLFPEEVNIDKNEHPLRNRIWNDYIWLTFGTRSAMLLAYENEITIGKGNYDTNVHALFDVFKSVLLDTSELFRSRWHTLVVLNWLLDKAVVSIRGAGPLEIGTLQKIINLRRQFSLYLSNPIVYRFEGGSFTTLAREAQKLFWIDILEETIKIKFHQVDRMYEEHLHRQALEQLEMGVE